MQDGIESDVFWANLLSSNLRPYDLDDLVGVKPWWELYQTVGGTSLRPIEQPRTYAVHTGDPLTLGSSSQASAKAYIARKARRNRGGHPSGKPGLRFIKV